MIKKEKELFFERERKFLFDEKEEKVDLYSLSIFATQTNFINM